MVLLDDNFASIVSAVEEGRGIYDNIQKVLLFLLSCNFGEILLMFVASLLGWPAPLLPIQLLWINLVTDGLPALALSLEPPEPGIMERPPRRTNESILSPDLDAGFYLRARHFRARKRRPETTRTRFRRLEFSSDFADTVGQMAHPGVFVPTDSRYPGRLWHSG